MPAISLRELDRHLEGDKPFFFPHESGDEDYGSDDYCDWLNEPEPIDEWWFVEDPYWEDFDHHPMFDDFYD